MALAVSLQHIALLTVELGDRAAMSAKAVTCCIRIFEVLEGTDILNADILDMLASTLMDDFASTSFAICAIPYSFDGQLHSIDQPFGEFGNVMCMESTRSKTASFCAKAFSSSNIVYSSK